MEKWSVQFAGGSAKCYNHFRKQSQFSFIFPPETKTKLARSETLNLFHCYILKYYTQIKYLLNKWTISRFTFISSVNLYYVPKVMYLNGTSLVVQRLRLCTPIAGGEGSIPGQGTRIPQAAQRGQKKKKKVMYLHPSCSDLSVDQHSFLGTVCPACVFA